MTLYSEAEYRSFEVYLKKKNADIKSSIEYAAQYATTHPNPYFPQLTYNVLQEDKTVKTYKGLLRPTSEGSYVIDLYRKEAVLGTGTEGKVIDLFLTLFIEPDTKKELEDAKQEADKDKAKLSPKPKRVRSKRATAKTFVINGREETRHVEWVIKKFHVGIKTASRELDNIGSVGNPYLCRKKYPIQFFKATSHDNVQQQQAIVIEKTGEMDLMDVFDEIFEKSLTAGEPDGLNPTWCMQIATSLAQNVAYLHAQGVKHRDIKPENVRVDQDGTAKLVDLSFALLDKIKESEAGIDAAGTLGYVAPEIFEGKDSYFASDVFSMGILMYILLNKIKPLAEVTDLIGEMNRTFNPFIFIPDIMQEKKLINGLSPEMRSEVFDYIKNHLCAREMQTRPTAAEAAIKFNEWFTILQAAEKQQSIMPMAETLSESSPSSSPRCS